MASVISFVNIKGGVPKSVSSLFIAYGVNLGIKLLEFHQLSWRGRFSSSGFSSQFLGTA
jgi:hypothetical protein